MCKYCAVEKGSVKNIAMDLIEVNIGGKQLANHLLGIYLFNSASKRQYILQAEYFVDGGDSIAIAETPIKYCPFCGKLLEQQTEESK